MTVKLCLNEECITQQIKLCPTETQTSALPPSPFPPSLRDMDSQQLMDPTNTRTLLYRAT